MEQRYKYFKYSFKTRKKRNKTHSSVKILSHTMFLHSHSVVTLSGKTLHWTFGSLQTDVHYSVLSLLLILSGSPSNTDFTERPRVKEAGEQNKPELGHTYTNMQTWKFFQISILQTKRTPSTGLSTWWRVRTLTQGHTQTPLWVNCFHIPPLQ